VCLTHDVDFVSIRQHRLDHTWWGFVYRATAGSLLRFLRGRATLRQLATNWAAVLGLPLVALGLRRDYWDQFERYADIEREFSSTFFLIPFKDTPGEKVGGPAPHRRATRYDILDVQEQVQALDRQGFEIGLHGIDAWHSAEKGRQELARIVQATGQTGVGVRMHWLRFDQDSPGVLEAIGCDYDSTCGYNDAIGYKAGTTQVFALPGTEGLLELPLHVQDTALFYSRRLGLSEGRAWEGCMALVETARRCGGVLTVLWHQRSLAPERLWGDFYGRLLQALREEDAWFATARQMVAWFRRRRAVQFEAVEVAGDALRVRLRGPGDQGELPLVVRVHLPGGYVDRPWSGEPLVEFTLPPEAAGHFAGSFG
jgi:hypothetical protein